MGKKHHRFVLITEQPDIERADRGPDQVDEGVPAFIGDLIGLSLDFHQNTGYGRFAVFIQGGDFGLGREKKREKAKKNRNPEFHLIGKLLPNLITNDKELFTGFDKWGIWRDLEKFQNPKRY